MIKVFTRTLLSYMIDKQVGMVVVVVVAVRRAQRKGAWDSYMG